MKDKKRGKTVNKSTKGYCTLSILEKNIYSNPFDYSPRITNRSIMEIAIYNPDVQKKKGIWKNIKRKTKEIIQK